MEILDVKLEIFLTTMSPTERTHIVTLLNALAHIASLTVRTLLYGNDTYEIEENKIIITETLRFIKESKRFD